MGSEIAAIFRGFDRNGIRYWFGTIDSQDFPEGHLKIAATNTLHDIIGSAMGCYYHLFFITPLFFRTNFAAFISESLSDSGVASLELKVFLKSYSSVF
jgi:hypothetical protein